MTILNLFKFVKIGRKFSKWEENTVVKGEIAPSHSVFKRLLLQTRKKQDLFGKWLKCVWDSGQIDNILKRRHRGVKVVQK